MKKLFTLITLVLMAATIKAADVTIYVQAEKAPYLYVWNGGVDNGSWPGTQMSETAVVQGTTFWKKTFSPTGVFNIIFNNGGAKQTKDITGISSDRYFTYDGESSYTDISEQYVEVPDAEVTSLFLVGTFNGWSIEGENAVAFTEVEKGKVFRLTYDFSYLKADEEFEDYVSFKLRPNGADWVGFTNATIVDPDNVAEEDKSDGQGNIGIDTEANGYAFIITATWAGGKSAEDGWTVEIKKDEGTAIRTAAVANTDNARYNMAGQRVSNGFRGIVIVNGKKMLVK